MPGGLPRGGHDAPASRRCLLAALAVGDLSPARAPLHPPNVGGTGHACRLSLCRASPFKIMDTAVRFTKMSRSPIFLHAASC
jgi:hypothetical protein